MAMLPNEIIEWSKQLQELGIVPPECRRVIIDISYDAIVRVYYEANADPQMFTTQLAVALKDAEVVSAASVEAHRGKGNDG